jgi:hypothetical protein
MTNTWAKIAQKKLAFDTASCDPGILAWDRDFAAGGPETPENRLVLISVTRPRDVLKVILVFNMSC